MGNFNSLGVPTQEQCITSTILPEMTDSTGDLYH